MDNKTARTRQMLIVDDDAEFMFMMQQFLVSPGHGTWKVHMAENCAAALTILKTNEVDLVILDVRLPVMDGLQFLTLLKQTHPGLPVVMVTGFATEEDRVYSLQNGAALFLNKVTIAEAFDKVYPRLEALASAPNEGFRGMLRQVGLQEILQLECLGRKSSIIEITGRDTSGRIYVSDGSIVHAETNTNQGEPALFQILGLKGGEFHLRPFTKPPRQSIDGHWESLLMEAARLNDEAAGAASGLMAEPQDLLAASLAQEEELKKAKAHTATVEPPPPPKAEPITFVAPPPDPTDEGPLLPDNRRAEEIMLYSGTGEVLFEWSAREVPHRLKLLDTLSIKSTALSKALSMGRVDRLEVNTEEGRAVILLQADRKAMVRTTMLPDGEVPEEPIVAEPPTQELPPE